MGGGCTVRVDGYVFDFTRVAARVPRAGLRRLILEAPQGFVRLLPRLASRLTECLEGVEVVVRLEPSYGLCSLSLSALELYGPGTGLVHIGHEYYPYPLCWRGSCREWPVAVGERIFLVPGVYEGGDVSALASGVESLVSRGEGLVVAYTAQHAPLARTLARVLEEKGYSVYGVEPIVGCFFNNLLRYREASAFVVVAGGRFHVLGLGLALYGSSREAVLLAADPYTGRVEDAWPEALRVAASRLWLMKRFASEARSVGLVVGLLPGQYRPGVVDAVKKLLEKHGIRYSVLAVERMSRELLDNLAPGEFDAYIVSSCPRLAVEDLADYWKPVLAPGEARAALEGLGYRFPW